MMRNQNWRSDVIAESPSFASSESFPEYSSIQKNIPAVGDTKGSNAHCRERT